MMIAAAFAPDADQRQRIITDFLAVAAPAAVIHICPKNNLWKVPPRPGAKVFAFEDVAKSDTWLEINSLIGSRTALILENVTRYPKITSDKVIFLQRLAMQVPHRLVIDIVPFTLDITYLYTPYSYLDRSVLGFSHWYAFREGFMEMDAENNLFSSHDPQHLAQKVAKITKTYGVTPLATRHAINVASTEAEAKTYANLKAKAFAEETAPQRLITRLADCAHDFKSRRNGIVDAISTMTGKTLVVHNLNSYATRLQKSMEKAGLHGITATSYQLAAARQDLVTFKNVIYAEAPIVAGYFVYDIESQMPRDATAWHVNGDMKVDQYLNERVAAEIAAIAEFMTHQYNITKIKNDHPAA